MHAIIYDKVDLLIDNEKVNLDAISLGFTSHTQSRFVIKSLRLLLNIHSLVIIP